MKDCFRDHFFPELTVAHGCRSLVEQLSVKLRLVDFARNVLAQDRVRLIGVCFGHQIIGRAMDVKVARSEVGWEVAVGLAAATGGEISLHRTQCRPPSSHKTIALSQSVFYPTLASGAVRRH